MPLLLSSSSFSLSASYGLEFILFILFNFIFIPRDVTYFIFLFTKSKSKDHACWEINIDFREHGCGGLVVKLCPTLASPWTVAYQALLSMGFTSQEYWSGLPIPSPGRFPTQESNPCRLHCRQIPYQLSYEGSP